MRLERAREDETQAALTPKGQTEEETSTDEERPTPTPELQRRIGRRLERI